MTQEKFRKLFPDIGKYFFMGKYSWNFPENSFRKTPWVAPKNYKIWKKFPGYPLSHRLFFGNSFRDLPIWVKIINARPNLMYGWSGWKYSLIIFPSFEKCLSVPLSSSTKSGVKTKSNSHRNAFGLQLTGKSPQSIVAFNRRSWAL